MSTIVTYEICRDCARPTTPQNAYWVGPTGQPLTSPRCRDCHEKLVREYSRQLPERPKSPRRRHGHA